MSVYERHPKLLDTEYLVAFDFDDCWTKTHPEAPFGEFDVAAALILTRGNIGRSARMLGRSRRTLETFIFRNLEIRDIYEDAGESFLDDVSYVLGNVALSGHPGACQYLLSNLGKNRGFAGAPPTEVSRESMTLSQLLEEAQRRGLPVDHLS